MPSKCSWKCARFVFVAFLSASPARFARVLFAHFFFAVCLSLFLAHSFSLLISVWFVIPSALFLPLPDGSSFEPRFAAHICLFSPFQRAQCPSTAFVQSFCAHAWMKSLFQTAFNEIPSVCLVKNTFAHLHRSSQLKSTKVLFDSTSLHPLSRSLYLSSPLPPPPPLLSLFLILAQVKCDSKFVQVIDSLHSPKWWQITNWKCASRVVPPPSRVMVPLCQANGPIACEPKQSLLQTCARPLLR